MSKLFRKIKSAFIIEDEKTEQVATPDETGDTSPGSHEGTVEVEQTPMDVDLAEGDDGEISEKFTHILLKALEANNQEGFDYIEFKRSVQNLKHLDVDRGKGYEIAYATAKTMGATPDGLVSSAERYLTVLKKEEDKFEKALTNQRAKQIEGKTEQKKQIESDILEKKKQIDELNRDIEAQKKSLEELKQTITEARKKIQETGSGFKRSYAHLVAQIRQDIENIKKYLN